MGCVMMVWDRFLDRVLSIRIKELIRKVFRNEVRYDGLAPVLGSCFGANVLKK